MNMWVIKCRVCDVHAKVFSAVEPMPWGHDAKNMPVHLRPKSSLTTCTGSRRSGTPVGRLGQPGVPVPTA